MVDDSRRILTFDYLCQLAACEEARACHRRTAVINRPRTAWLWCCDWGLAPGQQHLPIVWLLLLLCDGHVFLSQTSRFGKSESHADTRAASSQRVHTGDNNPNLTTRHTAIV